ncbi:glycosyltransferase family 2 protein [Paenibacillus mendelii]|uniref:Glycosyltransferase family 2 protein n=1 Tax=Paenibacillus mendelii TaxID=206163 RepID=A0ABV6J920_9BACL|nr:glycosyltransferase family 2 protein [Paenibacillus mendelii]MCQ6559720.1 glycosyltransferase family 2 protein [Paenibacillus mendelii]
MPRRSIVSRGHRTKARGYPFTIRNAEFPKVSVIIPAMNERKTIAAVIRQASQVHPETEVIVVANGSTDGTAELAQRIGARVIRFARPLGHDVGRSVGAREAKGDILLFTDADIVIPARDFIPLTKAVEGGVDVALNKYLGPTGKQHVHSVVLAKHSLNIFVAHPGLQGASLTTIPHAMSRKARDLIGSDNLAVPPKAQAIAIFNGLNVRGIHYVDVGRRNPRRGRTKGNDPLEKLIVGDHLEALDWFISKAGARGNRLDFTRNREIVR